MCVFTQLEDNSISVSAHKPNKCMPVDYAAACRWSPGALRKDSKEVFIFNGLKRATTHYSTEASQEGGSTKIFCDSCFKHRKQTFIVTVLKRLAGYKFNS